TDSSVASTPAHRRACATMPARAEQSSLGDELNGEIDVGIRTLTEEGPGLGTLRKAAETRGRETAARQLVRLWSAACADHVRRHDRRTPHHRQGRRTR